MDVKGASRVSLVIGHSLFYSILIFLFFWLLSTLSSWREEVREMGFELERGGRC
jgi:hypothetical protein